jgi:hypothetical protein
MVSRPLAPTPIPDTCRFALSLVGARSLRRQDLETGGHSGLCDPKWWPCGAQRRSRAAVTDDVKRGAYQRQLTSHCLSSVFSQLFMHYRDEGAPKPFGLIHIAICFPSLVINPAVLYPNLLQRLLACLIASHEKKLSRKR